jgi:dTDP-4-amino-4,6-dideoxygalactose transaminase
MLENSPVKLFDMKARTEKYHDVFLAACNRVLSSSNLVLGEENQKFESAFADYLVVKHVTGVANGSDALELALLAFDLPIGSEIGLAANCGGYSTGAILRNSLVPVYCDVDVKTSLPTLDSIASLIKSGVKAIIATHLYGYAIPEIEKISELCKSSGVLLLEDCAQSHGAKIDGKSAGTFGDAACFSFYPTKNLGSMGDAGAVVTNNDAIAQKIRSLRTYGWADKYVINLRNGKNSRMDEIQAAFLFEILPHLDDENLRRREIANRYLKEIKSQKVALNHNLDTSYVVHLFVVQCKQRSEFMSHLAKFEIGSGIHYPVPDHLQKAWQGLFKVNLALTATEFLAQTIVTLPCHPYMMEQDVTRVISAVNNFG